MLQDCPLCRQIVDPQPQRSHALCVTIPAWTTPGAVVAIDSRGLNGRLFAIELIGLVDRAGLLTVAQIDDREDVEIYIGNQPWPLVAGPSVRFASGDLILIVSAQAGHHAVASLEDMLASAHGWRADFDPAEHITGGFIGHTWLLSDERSEVFVVRPDRRRQIRQDLASMLGASSRELVIQPARFDTPDFAYKGTAVQTVLAALRSTSFLPSYRSRPVVCFVDARPVMLTVTWKVCPDGILDTGTLAERFMPTCPTGYFVWFAKSDLTPITLGATYHVEDGEVITVLFRPFPALQDGLQPPADSPDGDDPDDDPSGDDDSGQGRHSAPSVALSSGHPTGFADTGGTANIISSPIGHPNTGYAVMWHSIYRHIADLAGKWRITPVGNGVGGWRGSFAVCWLTPRSAAPVEAGLRGGSPPLIPPRSPVTRPAPSHRQFLCLQVEMWVLCFLHHACLDGTTVLTPFLASWACLLASFASFGILSAGSLHGRVARRYSFLILFCIFVYHVRPAVAVQLPSYSSQPAQHGFTAECELRQYLKHQAQSRP